MRLKDLLELLDPYTTLRLVYDDDYEYITTKELLDEDFDPGFLDRTVIKIDPEGGYLMVKLNEAGK